MMCFLHKPFMSVHGMRNETNPGPCRPSSVQIILSNLDANDYMLVNTYDMLWQSTHLIALSCVNGITYSWEMSSGSTANVQDIIFYDSHLDNSTNCTIYGTIKYNNDDNNNEDNNSKCVFL